MDIKLVYSNNESSSYLIAVEIVYNGVRHYSSVISGQETNSNILRVVINDSTLATNRIQKNLMEFEKEMVNEGKFFTRIYPYNQIVTNCKSHEDVPNFYVITIDIN